MHRGVRRLFHDPYCTHRAPRVESSANVPSQRAAPIALLFGSQYLPSRLCRVGNGSGEFFCCVGGFPMAVWAVPYSHYIKNKAFFICDAQLCFSWPSKKDFFISRGRANTPSRKGNMLGHWHASDVRL